MCLTIVIFLKFCSLCSIWMYIYRVSYKVYSSVHENKRYAPYFSFYSKVVRVSGVATGWHGRTMSRGPGAKGALERETKKKRKKEKKMKNGKEKNRKGKKRENETFQIPGRWPPPNVSP